MHYDEENPLEIDEHLKEDPSDGIVILRFRSKNILQAACTTKAYLASITRLFYQCSFSEEQYTDPERFALLDEVYVKVDVFEFPFFISRTNLNAILENTVNQYFILQDTPLQLKYTIDKKAADLHTGAVPWKGGWHCQEGTEMAISIVYPVDATNINEAKAKMSGKPIKRRKGWRL